MIYLYHEILDAYYHKKIVLILFFLCIIFLNNLRDRSPPIIGLPIIGELPFCNLSYLSTSKYEGSAIEQ